LWLRCSGWCSTPSTAAWWRISKKFYAHDENRQAKTGDTCASWLPARFEVEALAVEGSADAERVGLVRETGEQTMIQMCRTWLTVADNSGARKLTCIMPVGGDAGLQAASEMSSRRRKGSNT